jgi:broad specificity phosphatase PhoE
MDVNGFLASPWIVAVDKQLALPIMNDFDAPKIWFVRHAESEANVQRIYANKGCSFPLTANGLQNAQTLARLLSYVPVRAVYTSPLLRATQTAEQICKIKKIEMQVAPELSEYHMGIYEGTSSLPGTLGAISDAESKKRWFEHNDFDARSPGGESLTDMRRRFPPFVKKAVENCNDKPGIILMITHGGILTAMLPFVFENLDFNFVQARSIENLSIIKGELKHGRLACVEFSGNPISA